MKSTRSRFARAHGRAAFCVLAICTLRPVAADAQTLPPGWAASDVGGPTIPGVAAYLNPTYTVSGAGTGIDGTADQFTFAYRRITGDATIIARVPALPLITPNAQAGVMIRQGLGAGSQHGAVLVSRAEGITFRRRGSAGGATATTAVGSGTAAVWVRVDRRGSTVTASWSSNGSTWTAIGTDTVGMNNALYVGLAATSRAVVAPVVVGFTSVQASSLVEYGGPLPAGWSSLDIGGPGAPGAAAYDQGTFGLEGGGSDIGGTWDQFRFAYASSDEDVDIVARIRDLGNTNAQSKAGVTIRDSLTANGAHASMFVTSSGATIFRRRAAGGGATVDTPGPSRQAPVWLKLSLRNGVVTASQSADGASWTVVGTQTLTLPSPFHLGLAVTSRDNAATVTANVDNVVVTVVPAQNDEPTVTLTEPLDGATYDAGDSVTLSADASDGDGTVARVDFYRGATLIGSDTASPFSVAWASVAAGTYSLTAVATDDDGATTTSASRTITVAAANQSPAVALTAPADGATFSAPATIAVSADATDSDGSVARVDFFHGTTLIGSDTTSPYSATWSNVPAGTYSLTAVATDDDGATVASAARTITVTPPANQPPTVALTAPANGATFTAPGTVTVSANAGDTDGSVARVDFYQGTTLIGSDTTSPYSIAWSDVPAGTYSLTARATDDDGATTTSAARSITVNPPANQPPTVALTAPANGATFTAPANITVSANASDTDGSVARVDFYQGATLIGSDTTSPYSITWNGVAAGSYSLTARAIDDDGATTTSAAHSITVNPPPNQAPTAALTAPASGATFTAPATITVSANAGDTDGTVSRVDFYQGTTLIGSDTTSPYSITWNNVSAGTYSLTGRAVDNAGASTTSAAVTVTVASGGLPAGWTAADIGSPTPAGSTDHSGGTFTITAGGADIWNASDQFHFAYQAVSGDLDIVARVATIGNTHPYAKSGIMIRASLAGNAAHSAMFLTAQNGVEFGRRPTTGAMSVNAPGAATGAPVWVKLTSRGSTISGYDSLDGTTWTLRVTQTLTLGTTFYVGLAVTSHNTTTAITSNIDGVSIVPAGSNQPPAVALTAPASGATFAAPATITVSADAGDTDGTVARVDFYQGATLIGSDTTSPYSINWSSVPAGTYSLTARATDDDGATTTSAARSITVSTATTQRTAVFSPSPDHASLVNSYLLEIFAAGANPATATPIATQNLGKPAIVNGECSADVTSTINGLSPGNYQATVSAVGSGGSSRSGPAAFTR